MSKHAIEVKNVKKSFFLPHYKNNSLKSSITQVFKPKEKGGSTFNALNDISFTVEKGDFFGILGRNGSGKSTLLKIISEIYQPTEGQVSHDGKLVSFIELGVGFKAELTGRENVFLNGGLLGFSKQEVEAMYDDIVEFAELEEFMDQRLKNYSSGMRVRLAFSVAIRANADILILDEVLAVGDADFQKKCIDYFETLKEDGKTVILVTHSMGNVRQFCNRAIVIENGKVMYEGDGDSAADAYNGLFNQPKKIDETEDEVQDEQLEKPVTISDVHIKTSEEKVTIDFDIASTIDTKSYIAIDIVRDNELVGGVSYHRDPDKQTILQKNKTTHVSVEMDNIFGRGTYMVTIGVKNSKDHSAFGMLSNAASFTVTHATSAYLPAIIPSDIHTQ